MCQERSKDMSRDREEVRMRGTKVSRKDQNEQNVSRAEGVAALRYPRKDVASPLIGDRAGALLLVDAPLAPLHLRPIVPRAIKQLSGKIWSPGAQGGTIRKALISWLLLFRAVCLPLSCPSPISIFMEGREGQTNCLLRSPDTALPGKCFHSVGSYGQQDV